ncbi:hypothetical protein Daus18300_011860 [Diaporthe australafricana]|uniref:Uncharacterized protein n=1 Tax=Diaporthe australafricana TaxID=127596 RepID=A0ABR3W4V3_9PEZI
MPSRLESIPSLEHSLENKRLSSVRKRKHQEYYQRSYALAHPAPVYTDKTHLVKHLRSRQFLQIQRISPETNHYVPDIDVISFAPPKDPIRLVSALKGILEGKIKSRDGKLLRFHRDDVLLTRYPEDDSQSEQIARPPRTGSVLAPLEKIVGRDVVAVLRRDGNIVLDDGRLWTVTNHQNRSFEFTTTDEHGVKTKTKWILSKRRSSSSDDHVPDSPSTKTPEVTFNFSTIRPNARRHAVLATLTSSALQIKDTYHEPLSSFGTVEDSESSPKVVDEATRNVIMATGVWLVLTLGWSPAFKASTADADQQSPSWRCGPMPRPSKTW